MSIKNGKMSTSEDVKEAVEQSGLYREWLKEGGTEIFVYGNQPFNPPGLVQRYNESAVFLFNDNKKELLFVRGFESNHKAVFHYQNHKANPGLLPERKPTKNEYGYWKKCYKSYLRKIADGLEPLGITLEILLDEMKGKES